MKTIERSVVRELTADEEAEAQRIADIVVGRMRAEAIELGRMLASKSNGDLFGQTEFAVRDAVHRIGALALDAALEERKKRGTKGRALSVRNVDVTRGSKGTTRNG
jgi:hypothetical protein